MGGALILLSMLGGPEGAEAFGRMVKRLETFDGKVRVETTRRGEEEARSRRVMGVGEAGILAVLRKGSTVFRIRVVDGGCRAKGVADRKPVAVTPGRGIRLVQDRAGGKGGPPLLLKLVPRRGGALSQILLELDPVTFDLRRAEAEFEDRTVVCELLRKA